jgi:hypothetical protein
MKIYLGKKKARATAGMTTTHITAALWRKVGHAHMPYMGTFLPLPTYRAASLKRNSAVVEQYDLIESKCHITCCH